MNQTKPIIERRKTIHIEEVNLKDLFKMILQYKKSILAILLISLLIAVRFIYFKAPVYSSSALIEVTSGSKKSTPGDFLGSTFSDFGTEKVDKEIEILKTFYTNNIAIDKVDYHIKYFKTTGYKKVELYKKSPISIENITVLDEIINGKMIKLTPLKNGFKLSLKNSLKDKILHILFNKRIVILDENKIYPYNKNIKNKYFTCLVKNNIPVKSDIYFIINLDNHKIYESISKNLSIVQINPAAPLIKIIYHDTINKRADAYVNALLESFISQSVTEKSKRNNRIIDFINKQLKEIKKKLNDSEEKLEKYRIQYKAIDPTLQAQNYITELSKVEIELSKNKLNKILVENLLKGIKNNQDIDAMAPLLMQLDDKSTLDLINKLQEAQIQKQTLKSQYSTRHPGFLAIIKQIKLLEKKIKLNIKNLKISVAQNNASLTKLKKVYEDSLKSLPTQERTLINLKRDHKVSSETYEYLLRKKSENEMIKVSVLSDYRIIDHAYNNGKPIGLSPLIIIILATILGLILGIGQALVRNLINDTIKTKEDITKLTSLPIYGTLPKLKQKEIKLEVLKDPKSPFAESYRSLRTNLQFSAQEKSCNVILVTSTIMAEGKSTTSANLGAIFQMADYKCIVINMDLRKPTLHNYFEINNNLGMSTYLSGKNNIREIIHPTQYPNLDIIPSGPIPPNPSELILSTKMDELLDSLKEVYDYIIIDSAPLGLVTDTMHLMQYSDMNLIVVREGYSRKIFITDLNILVEKHNLKHIGIVMNSVDIASGAYGYGYGYGYGHDEGK